MNMEDRNEDTNIFFDLRQVLFQTLPSDVIVEIAEMHGVSPERVLAQPHDILADTALLNFACALDNSSKGKTEAALLMNMLEHKGCIETTRRGKRRQRQRVMYPVPQSRQNIR